MHKREISRGIALFLLLGGLIVLLFLHFSYAQQAILKEVNISVLDSTTPVVKSLFPPNATAIEAGSILFQYNATDYQWSNITNCSLVINNTVNITTTNTSYYSTPYAMLGNITRNMTALLEIGNYEWYVNCSEHRDPQFDDAIREEAFKMGYYYQIFYCLERSMRKLIAETIESTEGQNWWNNAHVPEYIIINVDLNMKKERDSGFSRRSEDEIDYTNFGELGEIIKKNWTIFGSIFNSQRALEKVIFNLNTIRNNIAHCSPLADDEILRLKLSVRDWFRLME